MPSRPATRGLLRPPLAKLSTSRSATALELCLLYRDDPERYERAAARWMGRLITERPKIHLSEIELAAAGFREALYTERGVDALRAALATWR